MQSMGFSLIIMHQYWLVNCDKCTALTKMWKRREVGDGGREDLAILSNLCSNFLVTLKLLCYRKYKKGWCDLEKSIISLRKTFLLPRYVKPLLSLVQFSGSVVFDSLRPHGLQHTRPPCPSPTPGVYSNSCPLSRWCHPTISSSVVPFSSCLQSFPVSGSFPISQLLASGGQSIGASASASVLPMNIQDWFPLGWTGLISLKSKGLSRVFSSTTVQSTLFMGPLMDFRLSSLDMNDCFSFFSVTFRNDFFFLSHDTAFTMCKNTNKTIQDFLSLNGYLYAYTHSFNNHSLKIHFSNCKKVCYHIIFKNFLDCFHTCTRIYF